MKLFFCTTKAILTVLSLLLLVPGIQAQPRARAQVFFPDLPGYVTLRCDFHTHTVFSDGSVWPTVRVEEAWRNGLDAIAISDHIEYTPHKSDIPINYGRSSEIARAAAEPLGILVIRGAEITRGEPPGHLNAIFLTNTAALDQKDYRVAIKNAVDQGAFLFWNHPGWKQPGRKAVWYAEQGEFLANGWLHGIEVLNGTDYEAGPHQWCIEKKLALVGNSDVHGPISFEYSGAPGDHRPMTLVFARGRTEQDIREALFARRTAIFGGASIYGAAEFLEPLFAGSIQIVEPMAQVRGKARTSVQILNRAPLDFLLEFSPKPGGWEIPSGLLLPSGKVASLPLRCLSDSATGDLELNLPCSVSNLLTAPDKPLKTTFAVKLKTR